MRTHGPEREPIISEISGRRQIGIQRDAAKD
jgi:hypothetical protein